MHNSFPVHIIFKIYTTFHIIFIIYSKHFRNSLQIMTVTYIRLNKTQLDNIIYLQYISSNTSTCFGRIYNHHQEAHCMDTTVDIYC